MVTKTQEELDAMTPAELKAHAKAEEATVFGAGHRKTVKGKPLEQGIGAPGHETQNHWDAMRLREQAGKEPPGTTDRLMAEAAARKKTKAA